MFDNLKKGGYIFLIFMMLMSLIPLTTDAAPLFKDVKNGYWAAPSIEWAVGEGLVSGYSDGTFGPDRPITEEQFAVLLIAFDCSSPKSFAANPGEHKSSGNYRYLQQKGIPLTGYFNTKLRSQPVKKGTAARIIAAYRGFDLNEAKSIQYLYENDLASGTTGKNDYHDFNPKINLTRAEAVVLLHRLSKQDTCQMKGLSKRPSNNSSGQNTLPPNFKDDDTIVFEPKPGKPGAVVPNLPVSGQNVDINIEKKTLIANGIDSTLISLALLDCNGNPIPYDDSLSFTVVSELGATIDDGRVYTSGNINELEKIAAEAQSTARQRRIEYINAAAKAEEASKADTVLAAAITAFQKADMNVINAEAAEKAARENESTVRVRAAEEKSALIAAQKDVIYFREEIRKFVGEYDGEIFQNNPTYIKLKNELANAEKLVIQRENNLNELEEKVRAETAITTLRIKETIIALNARANALEALNKAQNAAAIPLQEALDAAQRAKTALDNADNAVRRAQRDLANALDSRNPGTGKGSRINTQTDGPDLSVIVTAPRNTVTKTDTITFQLNGSGNSSTSCLSQPIKVHLDYTPQAELRLEYKQDTAYKADGTVTNTAPVYLTATVVRPGGQVITDYNGRVYFRSAEGAILSSQFAEFIGGKAQITLTPLQFSQVKRDVISAEIVRSDPWYDRVIGSTASKKQTIELVYESPLNTDAVCTSEDTEIAFVLDGSGSMVKNDRQRLRVTKSEEFIEALQAKTNIGTGFNSKGYLLEVGNVPSVKNSFFKVGQQGGTNIGDGLEKAFNQFKSPPETKKVAILLTDGKSSEAKALNMLKIAHEKNITIYTIGLGKDLNEKLLQRLAAETGGHYFHVKENTEISAAYQSILTAVTCGTPPPTCSASDLAFASPSIVKTGAEVQMYTEVHEGCGEIAKVAVRFYSSHGTVDYELYGRGQDVFRLDKPVREITNFDLYTEGEFLAFDRNGKQVGSRKVHITYK